MSSPLPSLNTLTRAEIAEYREKASLVNTSCSICAWCEKPLTSRKQQRFCCASCRVSFHTANYRLQYERLCAAQVRWESDRLELLREIEELKEKLRENGIS